MIKKKPIKKAKYKAVKKVSGVHKDTKSHNVKINVLSGNIHKKLSSGAVSGLRSLAKASQIIWKRNAWGDNELKNRENIGHARALLIEVIMNNGYTVTPSGKLIKAIH